MHGVEVELQELVRHTPCVGPARLVCSEQVTRADQLIQNWSGMKIIILWHYSLSSRVISTAASDYPKNGDYFTSPKTLVRALLEVRVLIWPGDYTVDYTVVNREEMSAVCTTHVSYFS